MAESAFRDLRKLADWFAQPELRPDRSLTRWSASMERLVERLGPTAIPLLGRQLASDAPRRREAARDALAVLASSSRDRVIGELRAIAIATGADDAKVVALGLLAELGENAKARFADPDAIQRRSALALAQQIETAADVASAADLMIQQLDPDAMLQMLGVMREAGGAAAHRIATEICVRLDVPNELRARTAELLATLPAPDAARPRRSARPILATVLIDAAARLVVVATQKIAGERRWRRWAVLVTSQSRVEQCLHDDGCADADGAQLIASLCADGYQIASRDPQRARTLVEAAARRTGAALAPPYYLGRDLLELGDAHASSLVRATAAAALDRALAALEERDPTRALALLARCDADATDVAAAHAAAHLALGDPAAALAPLERALAAEPGWPLHHWNLACALHALADVAGAHRALQRFVATSATPSALYGDPAQPGRVACAERLIAELERTARLAGTPLRKRRALKRRTR